MTPDIHPVKTYIRQGNAISMLIPDDAAAVIDSGSKTGHYEPMGLFISQEMIEIPGVGEVPIYIAMDNSTYDCWTEEFFSLTVAEKWLIGMYECVEDAMASDLRYMTWVHRDNFEAIRWIRERYKPYCGGAR